MHLFLFHLDCKQIVSFRSKQTKSDTCFQISTDIPN